jgi:hypothetical protein
MESLLVSLNEKLSVSTQQNDAAALEVQQLQARVSDMEASVISLQYDLEVQQDKASSAENVCALLRTRVATEIQSGVEFERHRNELLRIACGHLQEQLLAARSAAAALDSENSTTYSELEAAFLALQLKFDASVNEIVELKRSISFLKGTEFCQADASSQKPSSAIESLSSCSPDQPEQCTVGPADVKTALGSQIDCLELQLHNAQQRIEQLEALVSKCSIEAADAESRASVSEEKALSATKAAAAAADAANATAAAAAVEHSRLCELEKSQSFLLQMKAAAEAEVLRVRTSAALDAARVSELEQSVCEFRVMFAGLRDSLDSVVAVSESTLSPIELQREISGALALFAALKREHRAVLLTLDTIKADAETAVTKLIAAYHSRRQELETVAEQFGIQLASANQTIKANNSQVESCAAAEIDCCIAAERQRNDNLSEAVDCLKEQIAAAVAAADTVCNVDGQRPPLLAARIQELKLDRDRLHTEVERLQKLLVDEATACAQAQLRASQVSKHAAEAEAKYVSLSVALGSKVTAFQHESHLAQERASAETARAAQLEISLKELDVELSNNKKLLAESAEAIGHLNQRVSEHMAFAALMQSRAVAAEHEASDLKARASENASACSALECAVDSFKAQLSAAASEAEDSNRQLLHLQQVVAEMNSQLVAVEARAVAAESHSARASAASEQLTSNLDRVKSHHAEIEAKMRDELANCSQRLAAAHLSIVFLRSCSKSKDDSIKMLRAEYQSLNEKAGAALANDAALAGIKVALHEANAQRASLIKSITESQRQVAELTDVNDALRISITQLEKERGDLLEEIEEYRQVLAAADGKINEYEALHACDPQPKALSPAPQAWNLSDPARTVNETDTYVLQSSPVKQTEGVAMDAGAKDEDDNEDDDYSDMLQVSFL